MRSPILLFGTVWILSKFAAHVLGKPSASVSTISVGILRIVDVMGATVTECSTAMAESRVRMSTGRLLLGVLNVYRHTSPRFIRAHNAGGEGSISPPFPPTTFWYVSGHVGNGSEVQPQRAGP